MTKQIRVLFLEDNVAVVVLLTKKIQELEKQLKNIIITINSVTDPGKIDQINKSEQKYDLILLDEFSPAGSFHELDFEKFGVDKIISISSMSESNTAAKLRGVKRSVLKNYNDLDSFAQKVQEQVKEIIGF